MATSIKNNAIIGKVDKASNGLEALELVKQSQKLKSADQYDLIVLDLEMPILDGYQACMKINQYYELVNNKSCFTPEKRLERAEEE